MLDPDERSVPARPGRFELRDRASRFLASAVACTRPEDAARSLSTWKREFHDATHIAFAWRIGAPGSATMRSSDAGEPSGTAGNPIGAAILSAGLSDVLVGVARWFGGTKLGTGGLARAYREAAAGALADAGRVTRADTRTIAVMGGWARQGEVHRLVQPPGIRIQDRTFGDAVGRNGTSNTSVVIRLVVYRSQVSRLLSRLEEARLPYEVEGEDGDSPDS